LNGVNAVSVLVLESFFDFFKRFTFLAMDFLLIVNCPLGHGSSYMQVSHQSTATDRDFNNACGF
jgi:hypothetical protein